MITTPSGDSISISKLVDVLRSEGMLGELVAKASRCLQIERLAEESGVSVTPSELQAEADAFRALSGMRSAAATRTWLLDNLMSDDDFQEFIERRVLERKLAAQFGEEQVEERFESEKPSFDRVRVAQIVVGSIGVAEELLFRLRDESAEFGEIAKHYSIDDLSRANGGHLGLADRNSFSAEVCDALFSAGDGGVVGPFSADDQHYLFQVIETLPARLDDGTRQLVRRRMLAEKLTNLMNVNGSAERETVVAGS